MRAEATAEIGCILEQHMPDYIDVNVEVISTEGNIMEINIWAVEEDVAMANKELKGSGYPTHQLSFNTSRN